MNAVGDRSRPTLAVVGATGAVGRAFLDLLGQRADVWGEVRLLASARSVGTSLEVRGEPVVVQELSQARLDGVDVAVFLVPGGVARTWAPLAVDAGAVVVDVSRAFRAEPDVPLVVHAHNPAQVRNRPRGIVSSPTATTLILFDTVSALHAGWGLEELVVTMMESASGAGRRGIDRLHAETSAVCGQRDLGRRAGDVRRHIEAALDEPGPFAAPLALDVVPWVGVPAGQSWSSGEMSVRDDLRKILVRPQLKVAATAVRVPVLTAHTMVLHARFERPVGVEDARTALTQAPSVVVLDDVEHDEWPTPVDVVGSDPTFAGRLRQTPDFPQTIDVVVCGDNLRKAAVNAAALAELVAEEIAP